MKKSTYYFPVLIIVLSNVLYDIAAMSFPKSINVQAGLAAYYIIATIVSFSLFLLTGGRKSIRSEFRKVNWAAFTLALGCTGIDLGYVLLFRAGWNISFGSLVCNIMIVIALILVGKVFFRETLNRYHFLGIALCVAGFTLIQ